MIERDHREIVLTRGHRVVAVPRDGADRVRADPVRPDARSCRVPDVVRDWVAPRGLRARGRGCGCSPCREPGRRWGSPTIPRERCWSCREVPWLTAFLWRWVVRCWAEASRASQAIGPARKMEAAPGIEPGNNGFAIRRLTAWLCRLPSPEWAPGADGSAPEGREG
jgi:hypothetical protein